MDKNKKKRICSTRDNTKVSIKLLRSGALSGKMLLVRFFENGKIDAYFKAV